MIKAVILAGGSGTRLWPLSRSSHPKQFLPLVEEKTMLQATMNRLKDLDLHSSVTICNEEHRFFVAEQLRDCHNLNTILLEPVARDSAPAVALSALMAEDDPILLVLAADHVIEDQAAFTDTVKRAIPLAEAGKLVTFGVVPKTPHTGYGYLKKGVPFDVGHTVEKFVEKPSQEIADKYFNSDDYFWNSGIFVFRASKYIEELQKFRPDIYEACRAAVESIEADLNFLRVNKAEFVDCPSESIDYAVMEKTKDAVMLIMDAGWSDIGSWASLYDISQKNKDGNIEHGDVLLHESNDCYVRTDGKLVAAIGVSNLIIVSTKDSVMVLNKDRTQDTKIVVQKLKDDGRYECEKNREVYRPWGKYDSVDQGNRYQVKRITVNPGEKLSVQMHHHRAEHWIIVSGTALVFKGDEKLLLTENESVYLPLGIVHALENPGKVLLELIEVQTGSYLGEDDIVRYEDNYGRL